MRKIDHMLTCILLLINAVVIDYQNQNCVFLPARRSPMKWGCPTCTRRSCSCARCASILLQSNIGGPQTKSLKQRVKLRGCKNKWVGLAKKEGSFCFALCCPSADHVHTLGFHCLLLQQQLKPATASKLKQALPAISDDDLKEMQRAPSRRWAAYLEFTM